MEQSGVRLFCFGRPELYGEQIAGRRLVQRGQLSTLGASQRTRGQARRQPHQHRLGLRIEPTIPNVCVDWSPATRRDPHRVAGLGSRAVAEGTEVAEPRSVTSKHQNTEGGFLDPGNLQVMELTSIANNINSTSK